MKGKIINYLDCDKQSHDFEPLSRVCVDKACSKNSLICCICEDLEHKGHLTTPLKSLLEKLKLNSKDYEQLNPFYYSNKIEELRISFLSRIGSQKAKILNIYSDLEIQTEIYFNKTSQLISNIASMRNISNILSQQSSSVKAAKSCISRLMKLIDYSDEDSFHLKKQLESIIKSCQQKEKILFQSFSFIKTQIDKNIEKINSTFNQQSTFIAAPFHWSQKYKGHKIKINGVIAEQTNMESSGQRFALIDPPLSECGLKKQVWGIKIKKFVGWVGLGICLRNAIEKVNYFFHYTNIGHGSYLISSNGYSWSTSVKQFNSAFKTFQFTVNDIVYVEYDPILWKLRFRKNQGPQTFQLTIDPPPNNDSYHPCVNLCSTGDSVEIILPGSPLS